MGELNDYARVVIGLAVRRGMNRGEIAAFYGIPPDIVAGYQEGRDCGALRAREVIRVEIARLEAEKRGEKNFRPKDKDRYKGTRGLH